MSLGQITLLFEFGFQEQRWGSDEVIFLLKVSLGGTSAGIALSFV